MGLTKLPTATTLSPFWLYLKGDARTLVSVIAHRFGSMAGSKTKDKKVPKKRPGATLKKRPCTAGPWPATCQSRQPEVLQIMVVLESFDSTDYEMKFVAEWPDKHFGGAIRLRCGAGSTTLKGIAMMLRGCAQIPDNILLSFRIPRVIRWGDNDMEPVTEWRTIRLGLGLDEYKIHQLLGEPKAFLVSGRFD